MPRISGLGQPYIITTVEGDEVNAHSVTVRDEEKEDRPVSSVSRPRLREPALLIAGQALRSMCAPAPSYGIDTPHSGPRLRLRAIAGQSLLLSAKFGVEVAARQLKQRICRVLFQRVVRER